MPTIEVSPGLYDRLAQRAAERRTTVDQLVAPALHQVATTSVTPKVSHAEFKRLLDQLAAPLPADAFIPDDFSREDIYFDHD
jgi:hypothetical protein